MSRQRGQPSFAVASSTDSSAALHVVYCIASAMQCNTGTYCMAGSDWQPLPPDVFSCVPPTCTGHLGISACMLFLFALAYWDDTDLTRVVRCPFGMDGWRHGGCMSTASALHTGTRRNPPSCSHDYGISAFQNPYLSHATMWYTNPLLTHSQVSSLRFTAEEVLGPLRCLSPRVFPFRSELVGVVRLVGSSGLASSGRSEKGEIMYVAGS